MERIRLLLLALLTVGMTAHISFAQGLILSELCDPRQNYLDDRFIEICNTSSSVIDLEGWTLQAVGNTDVIFTWTLSGMIQPGAALVAGDATTVIDFQVDFPAEAWSESNSTWNGKVGDGARLVDPEGTIIDEVVAPGTLFENEDLVRNPDTISPSPTFVDAEWTDTPVELPTDGSPGSHVFEGVAEWPRIGSVIVDPEFPDVTDPIWLSVYVTDPDHSIEVVQAHWGTSPEALENEIEFGWMSDSLWIGIENIPAQEEGGTIYYTITAINDVPDTTVSPLQNFSIVREATLPEIQGMNVASPYDGQVVLTTGVITSTFEGYATIQDGPGEWHGLWLRTAEELSAGDSLIVRGTVTESGGDGFDETTLLTDITILSNVVATVANPVPSLTIGDVIAEGYEGVLVGLEDVQCNHTEWGDNGEWTVVDEGGQLTVGTLATQYDPILGSDYLITGVLREVSGQDYIEPRTEDDIQWSGDTSPAQVESILAINATEVRITFTEEMDPTTSENWVNYNIDGESAVDATLQEGGHSVLLTVLELSEGEHWINFGGIEDLYGNAFWNLTLPFTYVVGDWPDGYYDTAFGLTGEDLRTALHDIIDDHDVQTYSEVWDAYYTTDVRPDGYVWDIYSDIPGETPPYLYTLGDDQGGTGNGEGQGYTREHSWPKSWFGGEVEPMYTDIFILYPCDGYVNGQRGNLPYGEVDEPTWTSLNGSKKGPNTTPGYSGNVFEPIDAYKGDLARAYFYFVARYYGEDDGWPGSDMVDGANLEPWAEEMLLEWNEEDPVSQKEVIRNNGIYEIQGNRNPFVDNPDWVLAMFRPASVSDQVVTIPEQWQISSIYPNPFNPTTTVQLSLPSAASLSLVVYNINGRQVASLADGRFAAGQHSIVFDANGLANGIYFVRAMVPGKMDQVKKVMLIK